MSYIRIINQRKGFSEALANEIPLVVDRTNAVLGNPFRLTDHTSAARSLAIAQYSDKLETAMTLPCSLQRQAVEKIARTLQTGQPVALLCWCAPLPCHAEVIRQAVATLIGRDVSPPLEAESRQGELFS